MNNIAYISNVTERMVYGTDKDWAMNINRFDWVPGTGLYGIYSAYQYTNKKEYLDFLIAWTEKNKNGALKLKTVNSTAPFLTIIELYRITKNEEYKKICIEAAEYILNKAPRTVSGGLEHTVTEDVEGFREQIWADTLFMVCLFMVRIGKILNNDSYLEFAVEQLKIHHKFLKNKENGLFFHGYDCANKNHLSAVCWGRANAWIIYSTNLILNELPEFDGKNEVISSMEEQIKALAKYQHDDGGFSTVIDDAQTYEETSAAAGIAAGVYMAVKAGYVSDKYICVADKALEYVKRNTNEPGEVSGVSGGTPIMPSSEAYNKVGTCVTLYGQTLAILAAINSIK